MAAMLFFVLAGIILVATLWNFSKKPTLRRDDPGSEYLQTAVDKLRLIRASPHYYNTMQEIDIFIEALKEIIKMK